MNFASEIEMDSSCFSSLPEGKAVLSAVYDVIKFPSSLMKLVDTHLYEKNTEYK